jgi:hypothetical protein
MKLGTYKAWKLKKSFRWAERLLLRINPTTNPNLEKTYYLTTYIITEPSGCKWPAFSQTNSFFECSYKPHKKG